MIRNYIIIQGQVQGVGFRAATKTIADRYNIKGWVKNTSDGAVEIDAEGEEQDLQKFIHYVNKGPTPFAKVESVDISTESSQKGYKEFNISS